MSKKFKLPKQLWVKGKSKFTTIRAKQEGVKFDGRNTMVNLMYKKLLTTK